MLRYIHYIFDILLIIVIISIYFFGVNDTSKKINNLGNKIYDKMSEKKNGEIKSKRKRLVTAFKDFFEEYKDFFAYLGLTVIGIFLLVGFITIMIFSFSHCNCCCNES